MVADINSNEVTKEHAVPLSKETSASCQGSKAGDMGETCTVIRACTIQTSLAMQQDPPMDNVALFRGAHVRKTL